VYGWCMSRTNIDIDDEACERVMRMYHLETKREAINLALRKLAIEPMTKEEVLAMRGFWKDRPPVDMAALRADRYPDLHADR
jgi:Arc/MetJ family transcription regulator